MSYHGKQSVYEGNWIYDQWDNWGKLHNFYVDDTFVAFYEGPFRYGRIGRLFTEDLQVGRTQLDVNNL